MVGRELEYIQAAYEAGHLSGNGMFTAQCHQLFEQHFGFPQVLLTHSATAALEMAALLLQIAPGDEVILPSFTHVSTANAFALRGAKLVFADSLPDHPNVDTSQLEGLITDKTKVIVVVHYGGYPADMGAVLELSIRYRLFIVEDAAAALGARYKGIPVGTIGHLAAFSFHETKNLHCGEGGMLAVNDERFISRAEVIWEKGTDRAAMARGEVQQYGWKDLGSSFLPSELNAAYLLAQAEQIMPIQLHRRGLWERYADLLAEGERKGWYERLPADVSGDHNYHLMALNCRSAADREGLKSFLEKRGIMAVSHYRSLHRSDYFHLLHDGRELPNSDHFEACLLRLPLFHDLTETQVEAIAGAVKAFYSQST